MKHITIIILFCFLCGCGVTETNKKERMSLITITEKIKINQSKKEILNIFGEPTKYIEEVDKTSKALITHLEYVNFGGENDSYIYRFIFVNDKLFKFDLFGE